MNNINNSRKVIFTVKRIFQGYVNNTEGLKRSERSGKKWKGVEWTFYIGHNRKTLIIIVLNYIKFHLDILHHFGPNAFKL